MTHEDRTVEELQEELRKRGRPVSGTKDELVARLKEVEGEKRHTTHEHRPARRMLLDDKGTYGPTVAGHPFPTGADRTAGDTPPKPVSPGAARGTKYEKNFDYPGPEEVDG